MQKFKSINWSFIVGLIKCCLVGVISTLIGIVIFAVILKFASIPTMAISYINDAIKIFSIFIMIVCIKKRESNKLLLKSVLAGAVYALVTFLIFSLLNGSLVLNLSFIYDLLFAVASSAIISIIVNLLSRKTV